MLLRAPIFLGRRQAWAYRDIHCAASRRPGARGLEHDRGAAFFGPGAAMGVRYLHLAVSRRPGRMAQTWPWGHLANGEGEEDGRN